MENHEDNKIDRSYAGLTGENVRVALTILLICFLANFSLSSQFGVYDDDHFLTLSPASMSSKTFFEYLKYCIAESPGGRPIGFALNAVFSFLVGRYLSVQTGYLLGWLILSFNGYLIYRIVKPLLGNQPAFVAALSYILFPADLSKQILMHRAFVLAANTSVLLGILLYQRDTLVSRFASYLVAGLSLIIWEGPFFGFIAAPFLISNARETLLKRLCKHLAIFGGILAFTLAVRFALGEDRAKDVVTGFSEAVGRIASATWIGPWTVLQTFLTRPLSALLHPEVSSGITIILSSLILVRVLREWSKEDHEAKISIIPLVLIGGIIAAAFPYVLMYRPGYYPPTCTVGALSAVHAPAELGFAMICAAIVSLFEIWFKGSRVLGVVIACYFGLLAGFGVRVQETSYIQSWRIEKETWKCIIRNSTDAHDRTLIVIDLRDFPAVTGFSSLWVNGMSPDLQMLVEAPEKWTVGPEIIAYYNGLDHELKDGGVVLHMAATLPSMWPTLKDGNFIFFSYRDGELVRQSGPVDIYGTKLTPKQEEKRKPWKLTRLGRQLLEEPWENKSFL